MVIRISVNDRISVCAAKKLETRLVFSEMVDKPQEMVGFAKIPVLDWAAGAHDIRDPDRRDSNSCVPEICISRDCITEPLANCLRIARRNRSDGFSDSAIVSFPPKGARNAKTDPDLAWPISNNNPTRIIETRNIDCARQRKISYSIRL